MLWASHVIQTNQITNSISTRTDLGVVDSSSRAMLFGGVQEVNDFELDRDVTRVKGVNNDEEEDNEVIDPC